MDYRDEHNEQQNQQQPTDNQNTDSQSKQSHDQFYDNQSEKGPGITRRPKQTPPKEPKPKSSHPLLSGLVGGIISAVIVAALFLTNVIPTGTNQEANSNSGSSQAEDQETTPAISNTVASDDADVASDISEASKTVVGVINKKQISDWEPSQEAGSGSGIIYKKENGKAYIVTNNHVVNGASEVDVSLDDDHKLKAKVLGTDTLTDLAVLQVDGSKIDTVAKIGKSGDLEVGDTVIAIGNPLGMEFSGSVTKGIISGLERNIKIDTNGDNQPDWSTEVIQTDAAINPGNSGGALVNSDGEVIGINSMKIAQQSVEGIGFAIPIDSAMPIMKDLEKKGKIERPFIGVSTAALDEVPPQYQQNIKLPKDVDHGMVVANIEPGSPADKAGLNQFDVITKINDKEVKSILDLRKYMYSETNVGDTIKLEVYQNGKPNTVELTLSKRLEQEQ
ncbi:trypsin-like peptidase domain-containing protein [Lentibacillus sp. L22]|uniref:S1C family serine protease n=1 Tax=Lentibacillus TaxID=175304 RepID=UPI0022B0FD4A|nr:trypsin-like peptidase domain-containing protein [Lentibacillus daqui]